MDGTQTGVQWWSWLIDWRVSQVLRRWTCSDYESSSIQLTRHHNSSKRSPGKHWLPLTL